MDPYEMRITADDFPRLGSHSLVGRFGKELVEKNLVVPTKIRLLFEQTSLAYRQRYGVEEIIVPEFHPMIIAQEVLNFQKMGIEVEVGEYNVPGR